MPWLKFSAGDDTREDDEGEGGVDVNVLLPCTAEVTGIARYEAIRNWLNS